MKSLEFVNNLLGALEITKSITINIDYAINNLKLIKQDLEVLEIIKNCRFVGYQKFIGNTLIIDNITDEQYQKIEQWVEEQYGD